MLHYVFAYGTLKRQERNHGVLAALKPEYIGETITAKANYIMLEYDSELHPEKKIPGVHLGGKSHILGEVYAVSEAALVTLDEFEGVGDQYIRENIELASGVNAAIYLHTSMAEDARQSASQFVHYDQKQNAFYWKEGEK